MQIKWFAWNNATVPLESDLVLLDWYYFVLTCGILPMVISDQLVASHVEANKSQARLSKYEQEINVPFS